MRTEISQDMTTGRSAHVEAAQRRGRVFVRQPYGLYSPANRGAWEQLFTRMAPRWQQYASHHFLEGLQRLQLSATEIPRLAEINRLLSRATGFRARGVIGYVAPLVFLQSVGERRFPTTITVRGLEALDFSPEPDLFHDAAGHFPLLVDPAFAQVLVGSWRCALAAAEVAAALPELTRAAALRSMVRAIARVFWFTVETGLVREGGATKAYGASLLTSYGEIQHALTSSVVEHSPL